MDLLNCSNFKKEKEKKRICLICKLGGASLFILCCSALHKPSSFVTDQEEANWPRKKVIKPQQLFLVSGVVSGWHLSLKFFAVLD